MFKINFELQQPDKIVPWGGQQPSLHWFGLTDGLLWINAGEGTIYEYSDAAIKHWELNEPAYNDYQLSRFLEDFSETFKYIGIPIPAGLYEHIEEFSHLAGEWNELHWDLPDEEFEKFYDDEYGVLIQWYYDRVIDSGHLIGGPKIGFFRYEDKIKILWNSDYMLDNEKSIWKTPKGVYELEFDDFVNEVERFYHDFYNRMDEQVEKAVLKDWKEVELDKKRLMEENEQRKEEFNQKINMLKQGDMKQMNVVLDEDNQAGWEKVLFLYDKMISELGNGQEKS